MEVLNKRTIVNFRSQINYLLTMRFITFNFLILAIVSCLNAKKLEFDYGYPLYSPLNKFDTTKVLAGRGQFAVGVLFEPRPFILVGPRLGWTYWNIKPDGYTDLVFSIKKFEFSYVIRPRKQLGKQIWIFFEAAGMLEYFDFSVSSPSSNLETIVGSLFDRNEWGAGRSLGVGIDVAHFTLSINHDAHLTESIGNELAGLRFQMGVWF